MKRIGIIGGGFTGTMTAVQLVRQATEPCEIVIVNESESLNKGIAYSPYSRKHLLNVITAKMSAFRDQPNHFLDWVMKRPDFKDHDETLVANSFLPRRVYGEYLAHIWQETMETAQTKGISIQVIDGSVHDLDVRPDSVSLTLEEDNVTIDVNSCVIATGNHVPRNPPIRNPAFYNSPNYFRNPWRLDCVRNLAPGKPVLIIGNGLTMVDTVLGLLEQHFAGGIYSISPNGFNILPHRHNGLKYSKFAEELPETISLFEVVKLVNKHIKSVREYGVSAEPVIDSIRPFTQRIWKGLSDKERRIFMSRLRHLWGVARHRIPLHTHDRIQQLRVDGRLHIQAGRIIDMVEANDAITVEYFDKKHGSIQRLEVSRVINCTGPESDLLNVEKSFLKNCLLRGLLTQDALKLGIRADTVTFQVIDAAGQKHSNLFTLGSNLKGELWESTAVNELRDQAERLAQQIR